MTDDRKQTMRRRVSALKFSALHLMQHLQEGEHIDLEVCVCVDVCMGGGCGGCCGLSHTLSILSILFPRTNPTNPHLYIPHTYTPRPTHTIHTHTHPPLPKPKPYPYTPTPLTLSTPRSSRRCTGTWTIWTNRWALIYASFALFASFSYYNTPTMISPTKHKL